MLGSLLAVPASSATADDIRLRDSLIAEQEALINVYRCRFNIDVAEVSGGCVFGLPAHPAAGPPVFNGDPLAEGIAERDALIAKQEALLNVYRCRFDIDTELVATGCDIDTGIDDSPVEVGWHSFEEYGRHQPRVKRLWQEGAYTRAVAWKRAPEGVVPELRVACFDTDSGQEPLFKAYVAWNWFITSRIDTYDLEVELPGGEAVAFDSINSTGNEASFLRYEDDIAEFTRLITLLDGEEITVSSFIPFGGHTISATFDLTGSSAAIQPVLQECSAGVE